MNLASLRPPPEQVTLRANLRARITLATIVMLGAVTPALAVQKSWNNPGGGSVTTPGNWTPNGVPAAGDDHNYNLSGTFTVTYASPVTASNSIILHRGNVTFTMNATHTANALFRIGDALEFCTLTLTTGTLQSAAPNAVLGNGFDGVGTFNINDSDATFQTTTATSDITVGHVGGGVMNVTNGGQVIGTDDIIVGNQVTASGIVTVNGFNPLPSPGVTSHLRTTAVNGEIIAGLFGHGTINIQAGGKVTSSNDVWIAVNPNSQGTVNVGGTGLASSTLDIFDSLDLARNDNANAAGLGKLEITADGVVTVGMEVRMGDPNGSSARLNVYGGSLTVVSSISGDGIIDMNGGSITAASLMLNSGTLGGSGTINAPVDVSGAACTIKPGNSAGLLTINSSYDQDGTMPATGGVLEMELGGAKPTECDRLVAGGAAALGGTLRVLLIDDFVPADGAQFTLISAASITGTFDVVELPDNGQSWAVTYNATSVVVSVKGDVCPADVSGDGMINITDLLAVIAAWGQPGGPADVNGDNVVNISDLLAVIAAWGTCE